MLKRPGPRYLVALVLLASAVTISCGKKQKRPPNHPNVAIYDRNASRIGVVELIVNDPKRAAQVKAKYEHIVALVQARQVERLVNTTKLAELTSSRVIPDDQVAKLISANQMEGAEAFDEYINAQLELRKLTTEEEFSKLDKIR